MKKIISSLLLVIVLIMNISPITVSAASDSRIITSEGVFTTYESGTKQCATEDGADEIFNLFSGSTTSVAEADPEEEDPGFAVKAFSDMVSVFLSGVVNVVSETVCAADSSTGLGLFSQIYIFSEPVNVTNIQGLMAVTGIVQWIALTVMVFGILVYGYQVMTGKVEIEPFKFAFRYLITMILVYYSPYFVQDILGLNNQIVDTLGKYTIPLVDGVNANVTTILPMSFVGFVKSIGDLIEQDAAAMGLMALIVMLIVLVMCFIPLLKLVVWWYIRLFKIFLYTAISPLMFASLCIENTARTGMSFIRNFVQEVFAQMFLVIAIFVTGAFIAQLPTLAEQTNMGIIGMGIALYAALSFLNEVPGLASGMLSGDVGGGDSIYGGFSNFRSKLGINAQRAGNAAKGAAAMGKAHGTKAGVKSGFRGAASVLKKATGSAQIRKR